MSINLNKIATELYGKIQTRFPDIKIGDEHAEVLSKKQDIPLARFFEFEYKENNTSLGTIAITLDEDDGIVVQISGQLADKYHHGAYKFIRSFRPFAKNRLLKFDVQNIGKSNLDKRDYQFQAKRKEPTIMENKLYGTNRISYQDLGEARLIIRHSRPINTEIPAGRSQYIEGIYIESSNGERFKYPSNHINGARAMAEHIKHGGTPYDDIGKYVTGLSEELSHLRKFKNYVKRTPTVSESMGVITDKVMERIESIKKEITSLQRPSFYEQFSEEFVASDSTKIPEHIVDNFIDRLTIRTFNEELKTAFPYIYKLIDESEIPVRELSPDDFLDEEYETCSVCHEDPCSCDEPVNEDFQEIEQYESFMDRIVEENELFSPDPETRQIAIDKFNELMSQELKGGPDSINAIGTISQLINDPDLDNTLKDLSPELDARGVIQIWMYDNADKFGPAASEVIHQLEFGDDAEEMPDSEPEIAPEGEPEMGSEENPEMDSGEQPEPPAQPPMQKQPRQQPMAEHKILSKFRKARELGANLDTILEFGYTQMTIKEALDQCGLTPESCGFMPEKSGLESMLEYVSGFFNREEGNFPLGGERIKIKIKKDYEDGKFPTATPQDVDKICKFIDRKDPGTSPEQQDIYKLSGVRAPATVSSDESIDNKETQLDELIHELDAIQYGKQDTLESIRKLAGI